MYGLALCLPRVGQPQRLPVPHKIPKTHWVFTANSECFTGENLVSKSAREFRPNKPGHFRPGSKVGKLFLTFVGRFGKKSLTG